MTTIQQDIENRVATHMAELRKQLAVEGLHISPEAEQRLRLHEQQIRQTTREHYIKVVEQLPLFIEACTKAGIQPSRRQAAKFMDGKGIAWEAARLSVDTVKQAV